MSRAHTHCHFARLQAHSSEASTPSPCTPAPPGRVVGAGRTPAPKAARLGPGGSLGRSWGWAESSCGSPARGPRGDARLCSGSSWQSQRKGLPLRSSSSSWLRPGRAGRACSWFFCRCRLRSWGPRPKKAPGEICKEEPCPDVSSCQAREGDPSIGTGQPKAAQAGRAELGWKHRGG